MQTKIDVDKIILALSVVCCRRMSQSCRSSVLSHRIAVVTNALAAAAAVMMTDWSAVRWRNWLSISSRLLRRRSGGGGDWVGWVRG